MYDSTSTFKTRRKHHLLLLTCLVTLVHNVASMAVPISCPEPCECYLNSNGLQSARCSEIYMNQTQFPNVHVLVLRASESQDECDISRDLNVIFPQLNYLYMTNCSLTNIPEHAFDTLKYLQEIDLSNNFIENVDSSMFVNNVKLTYASLSNNPLRVIHHKPFLISRSISELDLSSCGIKRLPHKMFKSLPKLRFLTLYNNELSTIAKNTLPEGIRTLNLGRNSITHVPIAELEHLQKLREIDLSENPINCTCSTLGFQDRFSTKPVIFSNGMECMYPAEYRGRQSAHVPQTEICMAELAALKPDQEEDYKALKTNEILSEEKSDRKKHNKGKHDNIQDDFERDEVVPYDKKAYIDEMQSDSTGDEGSGAGSIEDATNLPDVEVRKPSQASDNKENNETKQDNSPPATDPETTKKADVTSYTDELNKTNSPTPTTPPETEKSTDKKESTSNPPSPPPESNPEKTIPPPESPSNVPVNPPPTENSSPPAENPTPPAENPSPPAENPSPPAENPSPPAENPTPPAENPSPRIKNPSTTEENPSLPEENPSPPAENPSPPTENSSPTEENSSPTEENPSLPEENPSPSAENPSPPVENTSPPAENPSPSDEPSPSPPEASTTPKSEQSVSSNQTLLSSAVHIPHAESGVSDALQKDNLSAFNLGYIIPCLAILIVILICLGIYLGQRSSHSKNWEPATTNNDGAELQDVSLLPENGKMPIVKNKYPAEGNSEQTERLMNDSNSSAPKSVWEHLEEPLENGNSMYPKDSDKLPNGQSNDKNEPIECAIAKVTTLPDSVPRTPLIRNT